MKRLLLAAAAILTLGLWRHAHKTERKPIGGRRCKVCKRPFANLAESGELDGEAYVGLTRSVHSRENGGTVERSSW